MYEEYITGYKTELETNILNKINKFEEILHLMNSFYYKISNAYSDCKRINQKIDFFKTALNLGANANVRNEKGNNLTHLLFATLGRSDHIRCEDTKTFVEELDDNIFNFLKEYKDKSQLDFSTCNSESQTPLDCFILAHPRVNQDKFMWLVEVLGTKVTQSSINLLLDNSTNYDLVLKLIEDGIISPDVYNKDKVSFMLILAKSSKPERTEVLEKILTAPAELKDDKKPTYTNLAQLSLVGTRSAAMNDAVKDVSPISIKTMQNN